MLYPKKLYKKMETKKNSKSILTTFLNITKEQIFYS